MIKTEAYNESKQFLGLTKKNGVNTSKLYTQKPLGFFSVTRNLAAYRTNQEGVLELMGANVPRIDYPITILEPARTNLMLQSQNISGKQFSGTVGLNVINAPDGTLTADSFDVTNNTFGGLVMGLFTLIPSQTYTFSVWLKGSVNGQKVNFSTDFLNLGDFTLTTEWVRYSATYTNNNTTQNIYILNGRYLTPSQNDLYYIWGAQLETGNTATAYIPTTNAPVTVPDVIEAGCPELLVENEATNYCTHSNNPSNASYNASGVTITANYGIAPDGNTVSNRMQFAAGVSAYIYKSVNVGTVGTNTIYSVYLKSGGATTIRLVDALSGVGNTLNLTTSWQRYFLPLTSNGSGNVIFQLDNYTGGLSQAARDIEFAFGQLELGTKATSYIPTTTTAVTRPADNVRNNTIGYDNEESTIFVRAKLNFTTDYQGIATLWDNDDIYNGYITMYYYISGGVKYIAFDTYNGSDLNQYLYTAPSDGVYSIAFAYHTGEGAYKIAINGVLITDDTFFNDFPSYTLLTQMTLGSFLTYFNSRTKGFMYFDTMLGNDSLENLTVQ